MKISVLVQINLFLMSALSKDIQNHHQNRIVGGDNAARGQAPYLISIQNWQWTYDRGYIWRHICGGAIICKNTILTAGHCLLGKNVTHLRIKAGIKYLTEVGQRISVKSYKIHKNFNMTTFSYDIGIIQLEIPLFYNKYVSPIRLPQLNSRNVSGTALLAGWGSISPFVSEEYTIMQFAYVPIIDHEECVKYMNYTAKEINNSTVYIFDYQVCAGSLNGGVSACNGDSGGPLAQNNVTIGIVSWAIEPCGRVNVSTIYTGTVYFIEWIRQNINSSECTLRYG